MADEQPPVAPAQAPGTPAAPTWLDGVPPEIGAWVTERGWKSPLEALSSHRGLEKLRGVPERELMRLPEKWADLPETADPIYSRLGRPEKPDGYEVPDVLVGDGGYNISGDFKSWAHTAGLSTKQAKAIAEQYVGLVDRVAKSSEDKFAQQTELEANALKSEWGAEYAANVHASARARDVLELSEADINGMERVLGTRRLMHTLARVGRTMGEHQYVDGAADTEPFGVTPAAAMTRAKTLQADPAYLNSRDPRHQQVKEEVRRLMLISFGESMPRDT